MGHFWHGASMVVQSYGIQEVHTLALGTIEWLKRTSGTKNSLQAVIFTPICEIGKKFFAPILAWWHRRIAYREFILCPSGRRNGLNELPEPKTVCRL